MSEHFRRFRPTLAAASEADFDADPTLNGQLTIASENDLTVAYAPFDHVEPAAKLVLLGITPGRQQAVNALKAARRAVKLNLSDEDCLRAAKVHASFSGSMRSNLVAMLDAVGIAGWLGVASTASLWSVDSSLVHFTSSIRYPVYIRGGNYSGSPGFQRSRLLSRYVETLLADEVRKLDGAVWIPLGPAASDAAGYLCSKGILNGDLVLNGLPHPSGANNERISYFLGTKAKEALSRKTNPAKLDQSRLALLAKVASFQKSDIQSLNGHS